MCACACEIGGKLEKSNKNEEKKNKKREEEKAKKKKKKLCVYTQKCDNPNISMICVRWTISNRKQNYAAYIHMI